MWIILGLILYKNGLITSDINTIKEILGTDPYKMMFIFVLLSTLRLVVFIPQTVFLLLGSICFGTTTGFILSMTSLFISQTIVYIVGNHFKNNSIKEKFINTNPQLVILTEKYSYKFLALGVICPIAPTDLIAFISASLKSDYKKFISIILLSNSPMIFLYNYVGNSITTSPDIKILAILIILVVSTFSIIYWKNISNEYKTSNS